MLRNAKTLEDFELRARDGKIGHVKDLYFDDEQWAIRYLVVETGGWLGGRRVLIAPAAVLPRDRSDSLPVDLTIEQVRNSPGVEVEQPVSREDELTLTQYYAWPAYWTMAGMADGNLGMTVPPPLLVPEAVVPVREERVAHSAVAEHHLRSVDKVRGFEIRASDGHLGPVTDFLVDDDRWTIRYLVVDTGKIWPIRKTLLAPQWIRGVGWEEASITVDLTRDAIRASPPYEPERLVDADYAARLDTHYRRSREGTR